MEEREIQYNEKPDPTNLTKKAVGEIAYKVIDKLNFKPGDEIFPVVERLGGRVHFTEDWEHFDNESLFVHGNANFDIYISNFTGPQRDRFTIAHELGHYILHSRFGEIPIKANRKNFRDRLEWEANWFAAAFLMPQRDFTEAIEVKRLELLSLAGFFNVSFDAVKVRKENYKDF